MSRIIIKLDSVSEFGELIRVLQQNISVPPVENISTTFKPIVSIIPEIKDTETCESRVDVELEPDCVETKEIEDEPEKTKGDMVINMIEKGISHKKIAKKMGIKIETVKLIAYSLGKKEPNLKPVITTRRRGDNVEIAYKMLSEGKTVKEVAAELGVPLSTAYSYKHRFNKQNGNKVAEMVTETPGIDLKPGQAYCQNRDCPNGKVFKRSTMVNRNGYLFCCEECAADNVANS